MLEKIVAAKKQEITMLPIIEPQAVTRYSLIEALQTPNRRLGLIAEVKKASPSKGVIKNDFDPLKIAIEYEQANADALSVLTDELFFLGHHTYLSKIKKAVKLPVLRKDFIISSKQIEQSVHMGADAILLIATILDKNQLHEFYLEAYEQKLECLVEVHGLDDVEKVLSTFKPQILGINNRDLKTFATNIHQTIDITGQLPKDLLVVSESGINQTSHLKQLEGYAKAILVGESFMRATTPQIGIETLFGERNHETTPFA